MFKVGIVHVPVGRPFSWRALWVLVLLQFLGNVAALPLLRATGAPVESPASWALWTALSVVLIGVALFLAGRIGLGAPLIEGTLPRGETLAWLRFSVVEFIDSQSYQGLRPPIWLP